jgi:5-formyltetrahydrofolate cyclo-ligase
MSEQTGSAGVELDALRRRCRSARRALGDDDRRRADARVVEGLLGLAQLADPGDVALYLPTDGEVDLGAAAAALRARGATLWLPVIGPARSMRLARWDESDDLEVNHFGILEPSTSAPSREATDVDVVLIPCVAVDAAGNRVGFGAGFYDRALAGSPDESRPLLVGIAFEVQVVDAVEPAPWDVPLDLVVTDQRVIRPNAHDPG